MTGGGAARDTRLRGVSDPAADDLLRRARALQDDLAFSTASWTIPSDRIIEDFADQQHGLRAQEHEVADLDRGGAREAVHRAFTLCAPEGAERVALLLELDAGGWQLLVPDRR
jgi:hypothetical protein